MNSRKLKNKRKFDAVLYRNPNSIFLSAVIKTDILLCKHFCK